MHTSSEQEKPETLYCFNCDNEAIAHINADKHNDKILICHTCLQAYTCGQGNPHGGITYSDYNIYKGEL